MLSFDPPRFSKNIYSFQNVFVQNFQIIKMLWYNSKILENFLQYLVEEGQVLGYSMHLVNGAGHSTSLKTQRKCVISSSGISCLWDLKMDCRGAPGRTLLPFRSMDLDKGRKGYGFPKVLASLPQRKSIPQNNFCPYLREQSIIYGFPKVLASLPQRKSFPQNNFRPYLRELSIIYGFPKVSASLPQRKSFFHKTIFALILEQSIIYSRTYHTLHMSNI